MLATTILVEEHRVITKVLECLEKIVEEAEQNGKLNADSAETAVRFLREFADQCHHAKEEDRVFLLMEEEESARAAGPVRVMFEDHVVGRRHVQAMKKQIEAAARGDAQAIEQFSEHARDFVFLLRDHIVREDEVVFPMADEMLAPDYSDQLEKDFLRIEKEAGGRRHSEGLAAANKLCERYGVEMVKPEKIQNILKLFMNA